MFFYQLKNELWKLFAKKRTYIGFAMFLLAQLIIILLIRYYPPANRSLMSGIARSGFMAEKYFSALTMATVLVMVLAYSLLPLYVALVGGDLVSKEAEDGTLRMILSRPVSRARLLCLKWLAGVVFAGTLVLALGCFGLLFCSIWFPAGGGLFVQIPQQGLGVFDFADGLRHFAMAHAFLVAKACAIMSLAFMFSCFNMKPAAAAILALSLILIDRILMEIPYFHDLQYCFLGYYLNAWQAFFLERIPWWQVIQSSSVLMGFSCTCLILGITVFHVRDIKS